MDEDDNSGPRRSYETQVESRTGSKDRYSLAQNLAPNSNNNRTSGPNFELVTEDKKCFGGPDQGIKSFN